ncbi:WhiB family transcriptional regulator [Streptomyces sp. NPDC008092]|uniref:WhiB family transcriptional regulator n=1 Tax=Streptomyces sp. NPDC008092 TaxID=3364808 RepID=UPI0036E85C5A
MVTTVKAVKAAQMKSSARLREEWQDHPHYRYRGCAPDADDPTRMAGNPELPVGAHHGPDSFEVEGQIERREREAAAVEVCVGCPVMVACDLYASSVRADGKLAEPDGVWGGRLALERHRALIARRVAAPAAADRRFQTAQKRAALRALAVCWDPFEVAAEASRLLASWGEGPVEGMDVRTANWQRSSLVRLLGLPRDVSRMRALAVAQERGLLEGVDVVKDDGSVPAVPPPTATKPAAPAVEEPTVGEPAAVVEAVPEMLPVLMLVPAEASGGRVRRERRSRRRVVQGQAGSEQLALDLGAAA